LIEKNTCVAAMEFSRCARVRTRPTEEAGPTAGLSKLNSVRSVEVDIRSRRADCPDGKKHHQRVQRLPE